MSANQVKTQRYWLVLFSEDSWHAFLQHGGHVLGFRQRRWDTVKQLRPGDCLLCLLVGISRWIGALRVCTDPYLDSSPIWSEHAAPARVGVEVSVALDQIDYAIALRDVALQMELLRDVRHHPLAWSKRLSGSPSLLPESDGALLLQLLREHHERQPREASASSPTAPSDKRHLLRMLHSEVNALLLRLGALQGFRAYHANQSHPLTDPLPSDVVNSFDVLWFENRVLRAAFIVMLPGQNELAATLLALADLHVLHPEVSLCLVAPDSQQESTIDALHRPALDALDPPLARQCHFLPLTALRQQAGPNVSEDALRVTGLLQRLALPCTRSSQHLLLSGPKPLS